MKVTVLDRPPVLVAHGVINRCGIGARPIATDPRGGRTTPYTIDELADLAGEPAQRFRRVDRHIALGLAAARLALGRAVLDPQAGVDDRWSVFVGSSLGCWASNAEYFRELESLSPLELRPALFARTVSNAVNGEIAIRYGIGGPSEAFVSGWTSGAEALGEAAANLSEGRCRQAVAGGIEAPDATLHRMHAALRTIPGLDWLPTDLNEAAAVLHLEAQRESNDLAEPTLDAYGRSHDPTGEWTPDDVWRQLRPPPATLILVANTVPSDLLVRWRSASGAVPLAMVPDLTGEIGAAGAPTALAIACERLIASPQDGTILIISRGIEGSLALLVVRRSRVL